MNRVYDNMNNIFFTKIIIFPKQKILRDQCFANLLMAGLNENS